MRFGPKAMYALGRLKSREMNRLEAEYSASLHLRKIAGEVVWYEFEGVKLRLADNTFYTPDFAVMLSDGELQIHECKGFMTDDANVKIKVANELYPFRFFKVRKQLKRDGGGFTVQELGA